MQVAEMMTRDVATCHPETTLARAAWTMWERDCGLLVVVCDDKVVGVITDRDIAMALATRPRPAHEIHVGEVQGGILQAVQPGDDVARAMELLAEHRLRRLPVVDIDGRLQGILALSDLIQAAHKLQGDTADDISFLDVVGVLKAVTRPRMKEREHREEPPEPRSRAREVRGARKRVSPSGS
jgi:CBS domain-containing protein